VTQPDIAVVGGGLLGGLLAWCATKAELYDAAGLPVKGPLHRCGWNDYSGGGNSKDD
jgi:hypothetical protein